MHKMFLIAVDSGKSQTKAVLREAGELHKVKFQTKLEEIDQAFGVDVSPGSFEVEFEGKHYLIGDMLDDSKMDFNLSKKSETHRICIYLAIAQLLMKSKQSIAFATIALGINIPLSLFKNEAHKTSFSEFIKNDGESICITINNKSFVFRIGYLLLLPEGIGPIYSDINRYRNSRTVIFDVGSLNVNIQEYNNLVPIYEKMVTADLGVNILRSKIADNLSSRYGVSISESDVEALYRDKYLFLNGVKMEESKEIVDQLMENHVKQIFNFARSRKLSFSNIEVVFVGGGSLLLNDYITQQYPAALIPLECQWSNVHSFLCILEAKRHGQTA